MEQRRSSHTIKGNKLGHAKMLSRISSWSLLVYSQKLKKPLHFREGVKCQNRQKWFFMGLNWVSKAVLTPDYDDIGIF